MKTGKQKYWYFEGKGYNFCTGEYDVSFIKAKENKTIFFYSNKEIDYKTRMTDEDIKKMKKSRKYIFETLDCV
jgi:hypothetical protein